MPIPQADRKRLIKQIDMAEQYQKIRRIGHCSDDVDCITHCTTFDFSDPKCPEHHSNCSHVHTSHCPDSINIIMTLDEINQKIQKIVDKDIEREAKFDYENTSEHIIEWSRHNLRAARQYTEKKSTILQMDEDEAFCTFDCGKKFYHKSIERLKLHILEKKECRFLWARSFGKIKYRDLRAHLLLQQAFLLLHILLNHILLL